MRWKDLAEIYKMHSFAPLSNLNFFQNFAKFLTKFVDILLILTKFCYILTKFHRNFTGIFFLRCEDKAISKKTFKKNDTFEKSLSPIQEKVRRIRSLDELYGQTSGQMSAQSPQKQLGTLGVQNLAAQIDHMLRSQMHHHNR